MEVSVRDNNVEQAIRVLKKKISLIDELMIEDINNLSISELEENISALKMIIDKYLKKIEEKKLSQDKAESIFK